LIPAPDGLEYKLYSEQPVRVGPLRRDEPALGVPGRNEVAGARALLDRRPEATETDEAAREALGGRVRDPYDESVTNP
jgi:hypothetical protein